MGFKFTFLCDLLSSLENNRVLKAATDARKQNPDVKTITRWFARHGKKIRDPDINQLALLSCMFPEKRTDRVYGLQDSGLARVIGRCLLLGSSRREELDKWRTTGGADLGQCVENVMRQAENDTAAGQEVTVEEIDFALTQIASRVRFSGPKIRKQPSAIDVDQTLSPLYRRLSSRDAKWLTRMILKTHFSHTIPEVLTMTSFHFLLPHLLLFQNSFEAAVSLLCSEPITHFPPRPEPVYAKDLGKIALHHMKPKVGIKIGRPEYYKARSTKHCCNMVEQRRMSVEKKYDGEYCQIHVDLSNRFNSIQIFSKSGKDSTTDRIGVHTAIEDALRIGSNDCKFKRRCVLEGELLVWSDKRQKIMPFHKLRKFVSRSGLLIGTGNDSPPQPYEHLMIVFFDILLLDDDTCLRKPHRERRLLLKDTIRMIPGISDIAEQRVIDFSRTDGQSRLEALFSKAIAERWEGLVLKGSEDPYFPILVNSGASCEGRWIKLKKDYIPGLGDTVDLAIVGAAYNARDASELGLAKKETWTHFFVGCLENKNAILQSSAEPRFRVIDVIDRYCMSQSNMQLLNTFGKFGARSSDSNDEFDIEDIRSGLPGIDVVFKDPFVVELMGAGFEKPSGVRYYTLRFPRVLKIHFDRSLEDVASFLELQLLADSAVSVPSEDILEEEKEWANRVRSSAAVTGYLPDQSQSFSSTGSAPPSFNAIPIHVDDRPTSSSSSDAAHEAGGNILASLGNIASPANARKRKAPPPMWQPCIKSLSGRPEKGARLTKEIVGPALTRLVSAPSLMAMRSGSDSGQASADNREGFESTRNGIVESVISPLASTPVFIHSGHERQSLPEIDGYGNVVRELEEFISILRPHDDSLGSKSLNSSLGMVFTDVTQRPLNSTILHLSQAISQTLTGATTTHHPQGRIFILDSKFLSISTNWKHPKFCLRKTWEKISKHYFCACIAWDAEVDTRSGSEEPVEEDPSTEAIQDQVKNEDPKLKLRISFDRREILVLGQFSSLEPLVRVG
ncbi:ATP dependent DNA ligase domain protein [Aspergillus stella-maris]|uniref:ATP dependent DNA ligase domain protein n=1 Tax=Aspergillus stella-maris TaxID=1810926 RepID=UPI003CCDFD52